MHIDNTYLTNRTVGQPEQPAATPDATNRPGAAAPPASAASTHVPSPELLEFLARVKVAPEVRQEVIDRVAQRLATGYYLTRDAAETTAEAVQNAQE